MKKIVLLCNAGLSTSALMKKMRDYAAKEGFECTVDAYPAAEATEKASDADCVLIGPQIAFQLSRIQKLLPNVPTAAIDMRAYGMMDAAAVIAQAKKLMGV